MIYFYGCHHHKETTPLSFLHGHSFLIAWATDTFIHFHHRCRCVSACARATENISCTCSAHEESYPTSKPEIHICSFAGNKNQAYSVKGALMLIPCTYFQSNCSCSGKLKAFFPIKCVWERGNKYMQAAGWCKSGKHIRRSQKQGKWALDAGRELLPAFQNPPGPEWA